MATYQIAPPEKFIFSQPDEWPKWIRRFERFWVASGFKAKSKETQVNTLVYSMGTEAHVAQVFECLPATWNRLENIRVHQMQDKEVQLVRKYLLQGWPQRKTLSPELKQYQQVAVELTEENGILFRGDRVVIPKHLHSEMLARLHSGHLGISKCRE